jgi:hypothetical protein
MFYFCSHMTHVAASADSQPLTGMAWELESLRELGDLCMRLARLSAAKPRRL